jgi:hypothetical protein
VICFVQPITSFDVVRANFFHPRLSEWRAY